MGERLWTRSQEGDEEGEEEREEERGEEGKRKRRERRRRKEVWTDGECGNKEGQQSSKRA